MWLVPHVAIAESASAVSSATMNPRLTIRIEKPSPAYPTIL